MEKIFLKKINSFLNKVKIILEWKESFFLNKIKLYIIESLRPFLMHKFLFSSKIDQFFYF